MRAAAIRSANQSLLVLAAASLLTAALAVSPKPDAAIKTRAIEASGQYAAFVPWETLKRYLSPEGIRIFGGAPPKGDEDDRQ